MAMVTLICMWFIIGICLFLAFWVIPSYWYGFLYGYIQGIVDEPNNRSLCNFCFVFAGVILILLWPYNIYFFIKAAIWDKKQNNHPF